jgi:hypothetical protein
MARPQIGWLHIYATYRMPAVFYAGEGHHAIDAGESGTATTIPMRVKLLFGQDVAARLL